MSKSTLRALRIVLALCAGWALSVSVPAQEGHQRPINVLFIMSDQHNAHALGCTDNGFGGLTRSLSPRLDQLAQEGVLFTQAHCVTPQCCPARYSVLTGRFPHFHGLRWNDVWEPRGFETFPTLARRAGYVTGSFGKHHSMWLDQPRPLFEDHGFDVIRDGRDYSIHCASHGVPTWYAGGNFKFLSRLPGGLASTGLTFNTNALHPEGYFADQAIEFLRARAGPQGDGAPFVCWLLPLGPHTPILPSGPDDPDDWAHRFHPFHDLELAPNFGKLATTSRLAQLQALYAPMSTDEWREVLSYYYGLIAQIDFNVGRVLDELDALGLADNTLVIYTSDHGEMASEMACWSKGAGSYEAVSRIPWIMRLPGVLPAGGSRAALVSQVDLYPTLLEITGVPVSDMTRAVLDGASILDVALADFAPAGWRQTLFAEFGPRPGLRTRMARGPSDKYSLDELLGGDEEYYELSDDPWELDDRIDAAADQVRIAELRAQLANWWNDEEGHAPVYLDTGNAYARPSPASEPSPDDHATGIATDVDPAWLPSTSAQTQRVMWGSAPDSLSLFAELEHMEARFNPGTLAPATTYWWRVDGINAQGTTTGATWSFTTAASGPGGPGLARAPFPARKATGVAWPVLLGWTPAADAHSQLVHFGPVAGVHPTLKGVAALSGSYDPGPLLAGTSYEWRIDSVSPAGTTVGDVWSFTTSADGLPRPASLLAPAHLDHEVAVTPDFRLRWSAGAGATEHAVHFGTHFPLPLRAVVQESAWAPGMLEPGRVYYWRIDERNASGTMLGWTWRFRVAE